MFAVSAMKLSKFFSFLGIVVACYSLSILEMGCAQIGAPVGGPRDSLPPVLLSAVPENSTINFTGKTIRLTFNEYIQIADIQKNLLVSPTPVINPDVNWKLRDVTIRLRDTMQPNTTYVIDLGNAIQDINENNPYRNYKYVFSTGNYIDSLTFSGNVQIAETGKADSTLIVLLYNDLDDSAVLKHKPRFITKLDSSGNFTFTNLAEGTYNAFALKDEGGQKYYSNKSYVFAFADSPVIVKENTTPVNLLASATEPPATKTTSSSGSSKSKSLQLATSISGGQQDLLTPITLTSGTTLATFDSTKIQLTDTLYNAFPGAIYSLDTSRKIITISYPWLENTDYRLLLEEDFVTDSTGLKLAKTDTLIFKSKKESDYGSIKINFTNLDKFTNPVLQFVSNNKVVNSYPLQSGSLNIRLFNPGDYEMRILEDRNQNGVWDPGNYELKLQPEKVLFINQRINIRANWDNEKDIVL